VPKPRRYPLTVSPIVKGVKLIRVLIDGGSSLNILFPKIFDQIRLSRSPLCHSQARFYCIVPGAATIPVGKIILPITFGTRENSRNLSALSKFMAILHYAYLVLKMPGPCGVISIWGNVNWAFNYDRESYETANRLLTSVQLQERKQALAEFPPDPVMPEAKTSKTTI
jgi:hypothetical protein